MPGMAKLKYSYNLKDMTKPRKPRKDLLSLGRRGMVTMTNMMTFPILLSSLKGTYRNPNRDYATIKTMKDPIHFSQQTIQRYKQVQSLLERLQPESTPLALI